MIFIIDVYITSNCNGTDSPEVNLNSNNGSLFILNT